MARRSVAASSAVSVRADSTSRSQGGAGADGAGAGGSSRMTCALMPPIAKALTPARRGQPSGRQGRHSVLT